MTRLQHRRLNDPNEPPAAPSLFDDARRSRQPPPRQRRSTRSPCSMPTATCARSKRSRPTLSGMLLPTTAARCRRWRAGCESAARHFIESSKRWVSIDGGSRSGGRVRRATATENCVNRQPCDGWHRTNLSSSRKVRANELQSAKMARLGRACPNRVRAVRPLIAGTKGEFAMLGVRVCSASTAIILLLSVAAGGALAEPKSGVDLNTACPGARHGESGGPRKPSRATRQASRFGQPVPRAGRNSEARTTDRSTRSRRGVARGAEAEPVSRSAGGSRSTRSGDT